MRLDRVYIEGYKNLHGITVDFSTETLTTVIIGQNGTGKSNLIEAITDVFRYVDINRGDIRFRYEVDYRIAGNSVRLTNRGRAPAVLVNGKALSRGEFEAERSQLFPDLVFGYYSGDRRRLETLFDSHQRRYYDAIKTNNDPAECQEALEARRLFYCRPIHGVFALLAFFAFPEASVTSLLADKLGITGFHSALALFHEPWFSKSTRKTRLRDAHELWGAEGPAGACARALRDVAFHPLALEDNPIDDYRDKGGSEAQFAAFLRTADALKELADQYQGDLALFSALEAVDISDLIRDLHLWVTRRNDDTGDVSFADLSDGERQLLMVLGLIRVSRGRRALFLLDEPDTHLNPVWQHAYLNLLRDWTGIAADAENCHIIMTSHNPLTISALSKEEVRVLFVDDTGKVSAGAPYTDPRGMGFTATLTEIFGLPTTLDPETQRLVDARNSLARLEERTAEQEQRLVLLNDQLARLGFMFEDREPLYQDFLHAWQDVRYADRPPLSPEEAARRHGVMSALIKRLLDNGSTA
ncbi:MAG TPA: AAA family ATPase [Longimicrobium sp.]|jgi:ABC-type cobalamin/Fe3+-siderophores transport system ATPase subunit